MNFSIGKHKTCVLTLVESFPAKLHSKQSGQERPLLTADNLSAISKKSSKLEDRSTYSKSPQKQISNETSFRFPTIRECEESYSEQSDDANSTVSPKSSVSNRSTNTSSTVSRRSTSSARSKRSKITATNSNMSAALAIRPKTNRSVIAETIKQRTQPSWIIQEWLSKVSQ